MPVTCLAQDIPVPSIESLEPPICDPQPPSQQVRDSSVSLHRFAPTITLTHLTYLAPLATIPLQPIFPEQVEDRESSATSVHTPLYSTGGLTSTPPTTVQPTIRTVYCTVEPRKFSFDISPSEASTPISLTDMTEAPEVFYRLPISSKDHPIVISSLLAPVVTDDPLIKQLKAISKALIESS